MKNLIFYHFMYALIITALWTSQQANAQTVQSMKLLKDGTISATTKGGDTAKVAAQVVATDVSVTLTSTATYVNATAVPLTAIAKDTLGEWSTETFTAKNSGKYSAHGMLCWTNWTNSTEYRGVNISYSGGTNIRTRSHGGDGSSDGCQTVSAVYDMQVGETLQLVVESSGTARPVFDGVLRIYRVLGY